MSKIPLLFPLLLAATACLAEDFTLADGTVLRNVTVQRKTADELFVLHAEGARHIRYDQLPTELQERYGMTPAQVAAYRHGLEEAAEERRAARVAREEARLTRLRESGQYPRYLDATAVQRLLAPLEILPLRECACLAAEWNRAEARRLGLEDSAQLYSSERDALKPELDSALATRREKERVLQKLRDELAEKGRSLEQLQKEAEQLRRECGQLRQENAELRASRSRVVNDTTIVLPPRPIIVPPPPLVPPPAVSRPPQLPRPVPPPCPPQDHSHPARANHHHLHHSR